MSVDRWCSLSEGLWARGSTTVFRLLHREPPPPLHSALQPTTMIATSFNILEDTEDVYAADRMKSSRKSSRSSRRNQKKGKGLGLRQSVGPNQSNIQHMMTPGPRKLVVKTPSIRSSKSGKGSSSRRAFGAVLATDNSSSNKLRSAKSRSHSTSKVSGKSQRSTRQKASSKTSFKPLRREFPTTWSSLSMQPL